MWFHQLFDQMCDFFWGRIHFCHISQDQCDSASTDCIRFRKHLQHRLIEHSVQIHFSDVVFPNCQTLHAVKRIELDWIIEAATAGFIQFTCLSIGNPYYRGLYRIQETVKHSFVTCWDTSGAAWKFKQSTTFVSTQHIIGFIHYDHASWGVNLGITDLQRSKSKFRVAAGSTSRIIVCILGNTKTIPSEFRSQGFGKTGLSCSRSTIQKNVDTGCFLTGDDNFFQDFSMSFCKITKKQPWQGFHCIALKIAVCQWFVDNSIEKTIKSAIKIQITINAIITA